MKLNGTPPEKGKRLNYYGKTQCKLQTRKTLANKAIK